MSILLGLFLNPVFAQTPENNDTEWQFFFALTGGVSYVDDGYAPFGFFDLGTQIGLLSPQNISIALDTTILRTASNLYPTLSLGYRLPVYRSKRQFFLERVTIEPSIKLGYMHAKASEYNLLTISEPLYGYGLDAHVFTKYNLGFQTGFNELAGFTESGYPEAGFYYLGLQYKE